jgi:hypothetical protein
MQPNLQHHTVRARVGRVAMLRQSMLGMDSGYGYVLLGFQWMKSDGK